MTKDSSLCFADLPLTKLTQDYRIVTSPEVREFILIKALQLCTDVPDIRAFYTQTDQRDPLHKVICQHWDSMMLTRVEGISRWNREKCHRMYLKCRSGSRAEAHVAAIWGLLNSKSGRIRN